MSLLPKNDWFINWFDSPYYHLLYKNRDAHEADTFLDILLKTIRIEKDTEILDLACGKGRHAISLRSKGYQVMGIDLSRESIAEAKNHEDEGLNFEVADMREFNLGRQFGCILNLFTSFGYFDNLTENQLVIQRVKEHLRPQGTFVLDYFNSECVKKNLPFQTEFDRSGVHYSINKYAECGFVIKEIHITDGHYKTSFAERVQLLSKDMICDMLSNAGFHVKSVFGNYQLSPFEEHVSERMIIIAQN